MANKGVPAVSSPLPPDMRAFVNAVREYVESNPSGGASSLQTALVNAGVITTAPAAPSTPGSLVYKGGSVLVQAGPGTIDYTTPPVITGLQASGAQTTILLSWNDPKYANLAYYEIYRSGTPSIGDAVHIGTSAGIIYVDSVNVGASYYYWVRAWSKAGVAGPWDSTQGTEGAASGAIAAPLSVTDAQIASCAVGKLTAGAIATGEYIESSNYVSGSTGYKINYDGTAEFSGVTVRGTVYATSGSLAGSLLVGGSVTSSAIAAGTITASNIAANTITGSNIAAGTVTADKINGTSLSVINGSFSGTIATGSIDVQALSGSTTTYTTPGTYTLTVPANNTVMTVTLVGGGGGGGGGGGNDLASPTYYGAGGGGGGSGYVATATYTGLTPGATYTLTVGNGGAGGAGGALQTPGGSGGAGNAGTATSISGLITANPGNGGGGGQGGGDTGTNSSAGGTGGTGGVNGATAASVSVTHHTPTPGGAGGAETYRGSGNGGNGGNAVQYAAGNAGTNGANGFAQIQFSDPNGVVLGSQWTTLINDMNSLAVGGKTTWP